MNKKYAFYAGNLIIALDFWKKADYLLSVAAIAGYQNVMLGVRNMFVHLAVVCSHKTGV